MTMFYPGDVVTVTGPLKLASVPVPRSVYLVPGETATVVQGLDEVGDVQVRGHLSDMVQYIAADSLTLTVDAA